MRKSIFEPENESVEEVVKHPEFEKDTESVNTPIKTNVESIDKFKTKREISDLIGASGPQIDLIYGWASKHEDPIASVELLISKLGTNTRGKELLKKVYQWIFFDTRVNVINKIKEDMER